MTYFCGMSFHGLRLRFVFSSVFILLFILSASFSSPVYSVVIPGPQNSAGQSAPSLPSQAKGQKGPTSIPGQLIVKFRKNTPAAQRVNAHATARTRVIGQISGLDLDLVASTSNVPVQALMKKYRNNPFVEYAEPNGILRIQLTPNDPQFSSQWGLNNASDADIDAVEAWDIETGSESVIVANVDTGIDYLHEDLAQNMWVNTGEIAGNGIDDDGNGYIDDVYGWDFYNNDNDPMDDHGHGTHTGGIIAAAGDNEIGVAGVSWRSKLMALKVFDQYGNGSFFSAASAIIYAADMGAAVSNNSYGCLGENCVSLALEDAFNYAEQHNMLNVVAAGNDSNNNDLTSYYPCNSASASVLCVAATTSSDSLASFSNFGLSTVDLAAPGYSILSTVPVTGNGCCSDPSGYRQISGTSMATPMVTGSAALLLSQNSGLAFTELKSLLVGAVDVIPVLSDVTRYGGRLNVHRALTSNFLVNSTINNPLLLAGQSTSATVTMDYLNNFNTGITLSFSSTDPNLVVTPSSTSVTPTANWVDVSIDTLAGIKAGVHRVFITATANNASADTRVGVIEVTVQTDVIATALDYDMTGETGRPISVLVTIDNTGLAQASQFQVQYYLSTDSTITASDFRIGSHWIDNLANGEKVQWQKTVWIPRWNATEYGYPAITPGTYYVGIIVDGIGAVPDSDPLNNVIVGQQISVSVGTDDTPQWVVNQAVTFPSYYLATGDKMTIDEQGNIYRLGSTFNGVDHDVFVVKYDSDGNQTWLTNYDSGFEDTLNEVTTDPAGNVYVVGYTNNAGDINGLTIKLDVNGNLVWEVHNDDALNDQRNYVFIGSNANVYTSGVNGGTIVYSSDGVELWTGFNAGRDILENSAGDIVVLSHSVEVFSPDGVLLWGSSLPFFARAVALDNADNIVVIGDSYTGTINDVVIQKFDASGNVLWNRTLDNGNDDEARGIATDSAGNIYVLAISNNGTDTDYLVAKYDALGALQWQTSYDNGGTDDPGYSGIAIDASDNVYITGDSCNYPDGGTCWGNIAGGYGGTDLLSIKYDKDGNVIWVARWDEVVHDGVRGSIKINDQGNLYIAGADFIEDAIITVKYLTPGELPPNVAPVANAGSDQLVVEGDAVNLVGTSSDSDGTVVSHLWTQLSGPPVIIVNATTPNASFTAPDVSADTVLTFQYQVIDDDGAQGTDVVDVTVQDIPNVPPMANAGSDQVVFEGDAVNLSGNSSDSDGTVVSHLWTQLSGPPVTIVNASTPNAVFTAPEVSADTVLMFQYQVIDDDGAPGTDVVAVTIQNIVTVLPPPANLTAAVRKVKKLTYHDLNWDVVNGATGYRLYTSSSASGPWTLVANVSGTSYSRSVSRRDFSYYVVTSYDDQGESDYSLWAASDGSTQ